MNSLRLRPARVRFNLLLVVLSACAHAPTAPQASPRAPAAGPIPASAPARSEPISAFMADHYVIATFARDCVIVGDIEALRVPLQTLADYEYASVAPGGWVQGVSELQEAARLTARASTLDTAAAGVATMGRICGDCHRASGHGPTLEPHAAPLNYDDQPDSLEQRMFRHMWGAEQLWEGLTTPSGDAWRAGAFAIGHAPEPADIELPSGFVRALAEVRELGTTAADLQRPDDRADLYGLLLTTCADCHMRALAHDF